MARTLGAEAVYEVANLFRQRCLIEGRSFLWPEHYIWNKENIRRTWEALNQPDAAFSSLPETLSSIAEILKHQPSSIQMIATDVLAAGCFFRAVRRSTQARNFQIFLDAFELSDVDAETWVQLEDIFEVEVPASFTHYTGGKKENYLSWLFGLMLMVEHELANAGRDKIVEIVRNESAKVSSVWDLLIWGLLHTIYPDQFVAVPGDTARKKILKAFSTQLGDHTFENDFAALDFLRDTLSSPDNRMPFDFYDVEILKRWNPQSKRLGQLTRGEQYTSDDATTEAMESLPINQDAEASTLAGLIDVTHLAEPRLQEINELLKDTKQLIFEGPPGSGKTYVAEKFARWFTGQSLDANIPPNEQVKIVQFHQSYGYEDFVQGIRPETNDEDQLVYRVRDGIFLTLCERAKANPEKPFVLIIDEINRGNISRIFGELLLLLEYRGMSVRLPYGSGDRATLTIPKNLYIIGTMNTADRSLAQIDYALRRRFYFVRFMPVEDGRAEVFGKWLATRDMELSDRSRLLNLFVTLNHGIREHLGTDDLQIGHSYFMTDGVETEASFNRVWTRAVSPFLNEYLHHHRNREEILAALTPASLLRTTVEVDPENDTTPDGQW